MNVYTLGHDAIVREVRSNNDLWVIQETISDPALPVSASVSVGSLTRLGESLEPVSSRRVGSRESTTVYAKMQINFHRKKERIYDSLGLN